MQRKDLEFQTSLKVDVCAPAIFISIYQCLCIFIKSENMLNLWLRPTQSFPVVFPLNVSPAWL